MAFSLFLLSLILIFGFIDCKPIETKELSHSYPFNGSTLVLNLKDMLQLDDLNNQITIKPIKINSDAQFDFNFIIENLKIYFLSSPEQKTKVKVNIHLESNKFESKFYSYSEIKKTDLFKNVFTFTVQNLRISNLIEFEDSIRTYFRDNLWSIDDYPNENLDILFIKPAIQTKNVVLSNHGKSKLVHHFNDWHNHENYQTDLTKILETDQINSFMIGIGSSFKFSKKLNKLKLFKQEFQKTNQIPIKALTDFKKETGLDLNLTTIDFYSNHIDSIWYEKQYTVDVYFQINQNWYLELGVIVILILIFVFIILILLILSK